MANTQKGYEVYPTVAISTPRAGTYVYVLLTEVVDKHREHAERIRGVPDCRHQYPSRRYICVCVAY